MTKSLHLKIYLQHYMLLILCFRIIIGRCATLFIQFFVICSYFSATDNSERRPLGRMHFLDKLDILCRADREKEGATSVDGEGERMQGKAGYYRN